MLNSRKRVFLFAIVFTAAIDLSAQSFFAPGAWKRYRKEWQFSIGASNFLGDLGGRDAIGTNFLRDWEISQTKYAGRLAFGYYLSSEVVWRSQLNFGLISGNDNTTKEPFRNNRNLNFRSIIIEFSQNIQWLILKEKMGNRYGLKNIKGRRIGQKSRSYGWYLTAGIGVMYFNPQSKYQGSYVNLRDYHTEGQGLPGGPRQYRLITIDIPLGIGMRKAISRQWGWYWEFTQHYTFTDYLDDVSTVYYDKNALAAAYGPISAAMSDPNIGTFNDASGNNAVTAAGQQRGDPRDRDNYMFLTIGAFYKIQTAVNGRGKRKKIKALF